MKGILAVLAVLCTLAVPGITHATPTGEVCDSIAAPSLAPPAGFDPTMASASQLACYGFPSRPTDPSALADWLTVMRQARQFVPFAPIQSTDTHGISETINSTITWAGYGARAQYNGNLQYYEVHAQWNVPTAYSAPAGNWVAPWVGIGGVGTCCIVQAGQNSTPGSPPAYRVWYEDYPHAAVYSLSPAINAGDQLYVDVYNNPGDNNVRFYWEDVTTGQYTTDNILMDSFDPTSAEAVTEIRNTSITHQPYWNFGTATFTNVYVGAVGYRLFPFTAFNLTKFNAPGAQCAGPILSGTSFDTYANISRQSCP